MQFPDKPTCHAASPSVFRYGGDYVWRPGETGPRPGDDEYPGGGPFRPFRTCSYCGSIHPEDLIKALEGGASLGGSDWKYGWPHKFYIGGIPHAYEDVPVSFGGRYADGGYTPEPPRPMGKSNGKFYSEHLMDEGLDAEALDRLILLIGLTGGIVFHITEEGKLVYSASRWGYQSPGHTIKTAPRNDFDVLSARESLRGYKNGNV